jgi:hypothetical protein
MTEVEALTAAKTVGWIRAQGAAGADDARRPRAADRYCSLQIQGLGARFHPAAG